MIKYFIVALNATLLLTNADCGKNPVTTEDIKPGSRNYTWSVDTIYGPYSPLFSIAGTSPTDLWTAGPGDATNIFYRYDGQVWFTDSIPRPISPTSIFSISSTDVWSCGVQGRIWHYDGLQWSEQIKVSSNDDDTLLVFQNIYGTSATNIYAIGVCFVNPKNKWGVIFHYDGISWNNVDIPKVRTNFVQIKMNFDNKYYVLGVTDEQLIESTYQLYEFDGKILKQIKSGTQTNDQMGGIVELGNRLYFIIGFDLYSYSDTSFIRIGRLSDLPEFLNVGFGTTTKDIFLGMRNGIAHYNGTDTEYLVKTNNNIFVRYGIVFEKDVFMMGRDSYGNNLIYHGKLNE